MQLISTGIEILKWWNYVRINDKQLGIILLTDTKVWISVVRLNMYYLLCLLSNAMKVLIKYIPTICCPKSWNWCIGTSEVIDIFNLHSNNLTANQNQYEIGRFQKILFFWIRVFTSKHSEIWERKIFYFRHKSSNYNRSICTYEALVLGKLHDLKSVKLFIKQR